METLAPSWTYRHTLIRVTSQEPTEFIDLTEQLEALVTASRVGLGFVTVQTLHTTTGIVVNELEPLLLGDFAALFERLVPQRTNYRHDDPTVRTVNLNDEERINGHAHCRALLLQPFASINIVDGALLLGRWQRVLLAELDGPRPRDISILIVGENRR